MTRKLQIQPPNWKRCGTACMFLKDETGLTHAGVVLNSIDSTSRYRPGLTVQIELDLLRTCCLEGVRVLVGIGENGKPFFYFPQAVADCWLDAGGRSWILAEIEARAGRDVIPFPGRRQ